MKIHTSHLAKLCCIALFSDLISAFAIQNVRAADETATLPIAAPLISNGAWQGKIAAHPRLFGPLDELRALAQSKPAAYQAIKSDDLIRDSIEAAGIVQALDGLTPEQRAPYLQTALENSERGATNQHQDSWVWMEQVALTFDFFHDQLTPAQRQQMIDWLNVQLNSFKEDESGFHNSILPKIYTYLRVAYATRGENPRADEFRDKAIALYENKVVPILNMFGAGGGFTEAGWYARYSMWSLVRALELARRVEGYDGFAKAPRFFYQRLAYELFQAYPGLWIYGAPRYSVEGDGSYLYGSHSEAARHSRMILEQYFRGSTLSRLSTGTRGKPSNPQAAMINFLYQEPTGDTLPLENAPLAHLQSGVGNVYARGDWSDDATWFRFNCGPYFTGHQHLDVGNFEIFRREPLATESGEYIDFSSSHSINWLMRSIAHNTILVFQPDEKFPLRGDTFRDGGRVPYANDGGQNKIWEWPVGDLDRWLKQRDQFERGDIIAYRNAPQWMYVACDGTRAYIPSKLKRWTRQIVFVRPDVFVICDRVQSTRADYQKTWLLHSSVEAKIAGQTATIAPEKARLTVQTLLPEKASLQTVQGYNYQGQSFPEQHSGQSDAAPQWRLEVSPSDAHETDVFLHVLSTSDTPVVATLVRENGRIGARIGATQVLFNAPDAANSNPIGAAIVMDGKTMILETAVEAGPYEK